MQQGQHVVGQWFFKSKFDTSRLYAVALVRNQALANRGSLANKHTQEETCYRDFSRILHAQLLSGGNLSTDLTDDMQAIEDMVVDIDFHLCLPP